MTQQNIVLTQQPILDVAREIGLPAEHVETYGRGKAKIDLAALTRPPQGAGRLVLVTAINPTPAGEGKTTTSVGLAMGMRRLGKRVALCLREPSLGPVFGVKGGGTGGGRATLVPADDINLHFTGDLHAITTAHNLLSAMIDNACHFGTKLGDKGELDPRLVTWGRALDMNDRALRNVIVGLGRKIDGVPRQERFDITAASEVMAILALSQSPEDLEARLARIVVGSTSSGAPITAGDVGAAGAMTALLRDALKPNLVQTAEGGPALVHAGPFGNIAHGCNSVLATRLGTLLGDYVITEAGFGFDLGGEKFLDIKCREMGIWPRVLVLVATLRAIKMHGGAAVKVAGEPNQGALERGLSHLEKHLETSAFFGLPAVVAINVFPNDTAEELALVDKTLAQRGVRALRCEGFARGGEGAMELAEAVAELADGTDSAPPKAKYVYELDDPLREKVRKVATTVYGAKDVVFTGTSDRDIKRIEDLGYKRVPICMAKTQLSLTDDPTIPGRPRDFTITVREVRLSAGAGFAVPLTGDMMTMPGLPREPAALKVKLLPNGRIRGLMQNDD
jgi:formate--tetrahydrofolate ligase